MTFTKKYLVGSISSTDNKASMDINVNIEEYKDDKKNYCDPVFILSVNPYNATGVHMKLNSIETRAFVKGILLFCAKKITQYQRQSGGSNAPCHLNIYNRNGYDYIGLIRNNNNVEISFKEYELYGFAKELEVLCDKTSDALFKVQQMISRNKQKAGKNNA